MKKSTQKKILGGTLIVLFLSILGAVLVTAELDDAEDVPDDSTNFPYFRFVRLNCRQEPLMSELTEEQQEEINNLRQSLTEENATQEEIREAINDLLTENDIELPDRDDILEDRIERTTEKLELLELQKQLREEGNTWEEIEDILAEKYDFDPSLNHHDMMGFRGGKGMGPGPGHFENPFNEDVEESET